MGCKPKLTHHQRQEALQGVMLARRSWTTLAPTTSAISRSVSYHPNQRIIQMIRVDIVEEAKNPGVFRYRVPRMAIEGRSRQPLIDACRQIKALVGPTKQRAGLFREGNSHPEISCPVEWAE
jgi:hypothetical protein